MMDKTICLTGTDCVELNIRKVEKERAAILTSSHARTIDAYPSRVVWQKKMDLKFILSAEHGLKSLAAAGEKVHNSIDELTGLKVYSLYGDEPNKISPEIEELIKTVDCIIYDLPDVGTRYYTYISSAFLLIDLCAKLNKKFIVADNPNPLGGNIFEGLGLAKSELSFVGAYDLPVRYGLSSAELFSLYTKEILPNFNLDIVKLENWKREPLSDLERNYFIPSPNLATFEACLLYPGTCLFEGTEFSEGRGTNRPFTSFSAPFIDCEKVLPYIKELGFKYLDFVPTYFMPHSSKYRGQACEGFAIEIKKSAVARGKRFSKDKVYREIKALREIVKLMERLVEIYPFAFAIDRDVPLKFKQCTKFDFLKSRGLTFADLAKVNLDLNYVDKLSAISSEKGLNELESEKRNKFLKKLIGRELVENNFNYDYFVKKEKLYLEKYRERIENILIY